MERSPDSRSPRTHSQRSHSQRGPRSRNKGLFGTPRGCLVERRKCKLLGSSMLEPGKGQTGNRERVLTESHILALKRLPVVHCMRIVVLAVALSLPEGSKGSSANFHLEAPKCSRSEDHGIQHKLTAAIQGSDSKLNPGWQHCVHHSVENLPREADK